MTIGIAASTHARARSIISELGLQNAMTISTYRNARGVRLDALLIDESANSKTVESALVAVESGPVYRLQQVNPKTRTAN